MNEYGACIQCGAVGEGRCHCSEQRFTADQDEALLQAMARDSEIDAFHWVASWPIGTRVVREDGLRGVIVKRGGQQWTTRNRTPLVRWDGQLEAKPVPWYLLFRCIDQT